MNNPNFNTQSGNKTGSGSSKLKKIKRPIKRNPPQTPQSSNVVSSSGSNQFAKIKRPVKKLAPQVSVATEQNTLPAANPFNAQPAPQIENAFNLDQFLELNENLPAVKDNSTNNTQYQQPQFLGEETFDDYGNGSEFAGSNSTMGSQEKKLMFVVGLAAFVLGFLLSKFFFSEQKIVNDGLQGVVVNAEVPRGRARCGLAEKTQGCVLYIMNPQRQELNARDFYDLASQLTGRQRFVIETGNMRYSNTKIRPGEIGQFNIPPLTQ